MKEFIFDKQYVKNLILPKIEKRIRNEILPLIDEKLKENKKYNNEEREKLYLQYLEKILKELNCSSIEEFIELEYINFLQKLKTYFPYNSIDHFIEHGLVNLFNKLNNNKSNKNILISDENN